MLFFINAVCGLFSDGYSCMVMWILHIWTFLFWKSYTSTTLPGDAIAVYVLMALSLANAIACFCIYLSIKVLTTDICGSHFDSSLSAFLTVTKILDSYLTLDFLYKLLVSCCKETG